MMRTMIRLFEERRHFVKIDAYIKNVSFSNYYGTKTLKKTNCVKENKKEYKYRAEKRGQYIDIKI